MLAILIIWFWFSSNQFTRIRYWPLSLYLSFLELFSLKCRYIFRILSNIYDEVFMRNECFRISPLNYHTSDAYSLNNFKIKNDFFHEIALYCTFLKFLKATQKIFKSRSSYHRRSIQNGVLGNFIKSTWKHLFQSLFFNKVADLWPEVCNFIKKETLAQVFSCEFCEISKNTFFTEHLWTTTYPNLSLVKHN